MSPLAIVPHFDELEQGALGRVTDREVRGRQELMLERRKEISATALMLLC